jgi:predicted nucleic acid-binding Zn ribbon protein
MRSGPRRSRMARVGSFVRPTLRDLGVERRIVEQQALAKWSEVVGPHIAAASRADAIRDGVLFVTCKSSMWSSELSLHKQDIMMRLNGAVGREAVKDIRLTARGFRRTEQTEQVQPEKGPGSVRLDAGQVRDAEETAALCECEELAVKVRQAVMASKRRTQLSAKEGEEDG